MQDVFRGKTDVFISFETFSADDVEVKLNTGLAAAYAEKLRELENLLGVNGADLLSLTAKFPDVITVEKHRRKKM